MSLSVNGQIKRRTFQNILATELLSPYPLTASDMGMTFSSSQYPCHPCYCSILGVLPLRSSIRGRNSGDSLFNSCSFLVRDSLDRSTVTEDSTGAFSPLSSVSCREQYHQHHQYHKCNSSTSSSLLSPSHNPPVPHSLLPSPSHLHKYISSSPDTPAGAQKQYPPEAGGPQPPCVPVQQPYAPAASWPSPPPGVPAPHPAHEPTL